MFFKKIVHSILLTYFLSYIWVEKFKLNFNKYFFITLKKTGLKRYYAELFCDYQSMMKDGICVHLVAFCWFFDKKLICYSKLVLFLFLLCNEVIFWDWRVSFWRRLFALYLIILFKPIYLGIITHSYFFNISNIL